MIKDIYVPMEKKKYCLPKQWLLFICAFLVFPVLAESQDKIESVRIIHGQVVNASSGLPLQDVTIQVKSTTNGTTTDKEGNFSLRVSDNSILVFSYLGFDKVEMAVGNQTSFNIKLSPSNTTLNQLVVIGYGVQQKKLTTGATVEVKGANIEKRANISPLSALQGQTPGVSITSTGAAPGSQGFRVNIRGAGTVGQTTPLFIVDGVQTSDITYLNSSDIASIDVLKDAASAAIYGARAANGVILITTKTGTPGFSQVSFDAYYGIQNASKRIKVLGAKDYIDMMNEMYTNSGRPLLYADEAHNKDIINKVGGGTDWMDLILGKNVPIENYNLGTQGGTDKSTYALSLSYAKQGSLIGGSDLSDYKRVTFRLNTEHKVYKDILTMGQHLSYSNERKYGGNNYPVNGAIRTPPTLQNRNADDPSRYYYNSSTATGGDNADGLLSTEITNPYAVMLNSNYNLNKYNKVIGDVYVELKILDNLKFRSALTLDYAASSYRGYQAIYPNLSAIVNTKSGVTIVAQSISEHLAIGSENTLNYTTSIHGDHMIDALVGMSSLKTHDEYLSAGNRNLLYDGFDYAWINNAKGTNSSGTMNMSGSPTDDALLSYFGRVNYNYQGKYLASVILRSDGSSRFDKDHRRGYFPSFSVGWNVTSESFMQSTSSWLTYLKLRGSWGQNGNMNIPPYYYLALVGSYFPYSLGGDGNSVVGAAITNAGNASLSWEKSQSTNLGFDAQLFNSGFGIAFDWYNRKTRDWLVLENIPSIYGIGAPYINGGDVMNKGIELSVSYTKNVNKDFNYSLSGNVAFNKNTVGSIPTKDGILHGRTETLYPNSAEVTRSQDGFPLGYFWGLKTNGIFQTEDEVANYVGKDGKMIQPDARPGDIRYVDRNGDGQIRDDDKTMIGDGHPDFIFGLTGAISYKGFDFYVVANGVTGNQILQNYMDPTRTHWNMTQDLYNKRWHGEGTSNRYPRLDAQMSNWINFSDVFLYNGSYLKINTVTLGYDFAKTMLKIKQFSELRLYITGQNLYNFTSYNGMDPEVGTGNNGADQSEIGRDTGIYPHARTILVGINIKF